jgi:hypothetical protein
MRWRTFRRAPATCSTHARLRFAPNRSGCADHDGDHQRIGSSQQLIFDHFLSVSFIAVLPAAEKAEVADKLKALIDRQLADLLRTNTSIVANAGFA